jgi:hypothetical protein
MATAAPQVPGIHEEFARGLECYSLRKQSTTASGKGIGRRLTGAGMIIAKGCRLEQPWNGPEGNNRCGSDPIDKPVSRSKRIIAACQTGRAQRRED